MHRVLLVGDSLFADTLKQMLAASGQIEVAGVCQRLEDLSESMAACRPDAVVVAATHESALPPWLWLRLGDDAPIIYTTLEDNHLTIFTSRRVKAAQVELLAAITALPNRYQV